MLSVAVALMATVVSSFFLNVHSTERKLTNKFCGSYPGQMHAQTYYFIAGMHVPPPPSPIQILNLFPLPWNNKNITPLLHNQEYVEVQPWTFALPHQKSFSFELTLALLHLLINRGKNHLELWRLVPKKKNHNLNVDTYISRGRHTQIEARTFRSETEGSANDGPLDGVVMHLANS